jgi:LPXTG-motif cell wall-anchored protein
MALGSRNIIIKMKINKKYIIGTGVLIIFITLLNSYVSAFSLGSAYHSNNPLELSIGETKEINFNIQNMAGSENVSARMGISEGTEILTLTNPDEIYFIPLRGEVDVIVKATLPADAKIGDIYPVEVSVNTVEVGEKGTFGFGKSIGRKFDVIVVPTAEERARLAEKTLIASWIIYLIVGIIVLVALILFFWFRKKRKK